MILMLLMLPPPRDKYPAWPSTPAVTVFFWNLLISEMQSSTFCSFSGLYSQLWYCLNPDNVPWRRSMCLSEWLCEAHQSLGLLLDLGKKRKVSVFPYILIGTLCDTVDCFSDSLWKRCPLELTQLRLRFTDWSAFIDLHQSLTIVCFCTE